MSEKFAVENPNSHTEHHPRKTYPHLKWHRKVLKTIEGYRKSGAELVTSFRNRALISTIASCFSTPGLSESEFNDSLGAYSSMLRNIYRSIEQAKGSPQAPKILKWKRDLRSINDQPPRFARWNV